MAPNDCCKDDASPNRVLVPDHPDARPDLQVRICRVCGRRHFELTVDPGVIFARGASL